MKELFQKAKELPVKFNKNTQMYEVRGMIAGIFIPGLFAISATAYALDRITNHFTNKYLWDRDGSINKRVYGEDDSIKHDFLQAIRPQFLASPRMARAAA